MKYLRNLLFADDAVVTAHSAEAFSGSWTRPAKTLDQPYSLKKNKTHVMAQDLDSPHSITISKHVHEKEVVHDFEYLGSTI